MKANESGKSYRVIAEEFGIGQTQVGNIMKKKAEINTCPRIIATAIKREEKYSDSMRNE